MVPEHGTGERLTGRRPPSRHVDFHRREFPVLPHPSSDRRRNGPVALAVDFGGSDMRVPQGNPRGFDPVSLANLRRGEMS